LSLAEIQGQNWEIGSEWAALVSKTRNKTKALLDLLYAAGRYQKEEFYDNYHGPSKILIELT